MSRQLHQARPDPFSDEPQLKPALPQSRKSGGVPGIQVIVVCLGIDFALILVRPGVSKLVTSELGESIALGVVYGLIAAQFAMAAIWLGVMATALYWMLVGLVLFSITVLALVPASAPWPTVLVVAWGALTFTLPFALVRLGGFRLEQRRATLVRDFTAEPIVEPIGEPIRFPLSRLFAWTFVIAAVLGVGQSLPAGIAISLATSLRFFAVAVVALATLWAVLWPGSVRHPRWLGPFALLAALVFFGQRAYGLRMADTVGVAIAGLSFILTLAGLLAFYRAAGWRLMAGSGRGWLVR